MNEILDVLFARTWWSWHRDRDLWYSPAYHGFNLLEGAAWIVFAGLVLRRRADRGRTTRELWYAAAFFTFGLTDFVEAWRQASWLLWIKLINLVLLLRLRRAVLTRLYPESRLY